MKYTKKRISLLLQVYDQFRDDVSSLVDEAGHRGSLESIDYISGDKLMVSTLWRSRCGDHEHEQVGIPLAWLETRDWDEVRKMVKAEKEEKDRALAARYAEEARKAAEQKKARDLAELERLKKQYETNQGEQQ